MYQWLSWEFMTVECTRTCEQRVACDRQSIHIEAVTTNREIVADHLAYTQVYMFLVAGKHGQRRKDEREQRYE